MAVNYEGKSFMEQVSSFTNLDSTDSLHNNNPKVSYFGEIKSC